jgi:hypothetical protein
MPTRTPATISAILTIVILVLLAIVFVLLQMVALNGVSERQGFSAMGVSLACQGIVMILLGILAARATAFLITKVEWNSRYDNSAENHPCGKRMPRGETTLLNLFGR